MDTVVFLQDKWSDNAFVPLYLFLGGLAAGMFIVAVATDLAGIWSRRAAAAAAFVAHGPLPAPALSGGFHPLHPGARARCAVRRRRPTASSRFGRVFPDHPSRQAGTRIIISDLFYQL